MSKQTVVVTGANRGIGFEFTKQYLGKGYFVIAVCRKSSKALINLTLEFPESLEIIENIDVGSDEVVQTLSHSLDGRHIDILVNNAGILRPHRFENMSINEMNEQYNVNTLGPIRVVKSLIQNLSSGSKIALITSRMGSIEDNTSGGQYGYRMSKCALNAAGKSMAVDFREKGIAVALLHPGYVQTDMVAHRGDISAETSVCRLIQRIENLNIDNSGTFWHSNGEVLPW